MFKTIEEARAYRDYEYEQYKRADYNELFGADKKVPIFIYVLDGEYHAVPAYETHIAERHGATLVE